MELSWLGRRWWPDDDACLCSQIDTTVQYCHFSPFPFLASPLDFEQESQTDMGWLTSLAYLDQHLCFSVYLEVAHWFIADIQRSYSKFFYFLCFFYHKGNDIVFLLTEKTHCANWKQEQSMIDKYEQHWKASNFSQDIICAVCCLLHDFLM